MSMATGNPVSIADIEGEHALPSPYPPVSIDLGSDYHKLFDAVETELKRRGEPVECPLRHRFTPGLYIREIFMPAGALVTSKIHRTEHPYTISQGRVSVLTERDGWVELRAPYTGITLPGTRRVLYIHEDTVWTTYHPTNETDLGVIENILIEPHGEHLAKLEHPLPQPCFEQGAPACHG